jgi:uncharacterized protein (TIGR00730 family)
MPITSLCVFCGSFPGEDVYQNAARELGGLLARQGVRVVYGGARVGLMGLVADSALAAGGEVIGVLPRKLQDKELAHPGLTRLHIVETLHERKAMMAELSDGFIALPGGIGTLEEIFEVWSWAALGFHRKPCGFLNVAGYYDHLLAQIAHMEQTGFVRTPYAKMLVVAESAAALLKDFREYAPPAEKW